MAAPSIDGMSADSLSGLRESFAIQMVCLSSPSYDCTELPTVKLYRDSLAKHMSKAKPGFVSFEGFVDAMVMVDGLRKAGAALTRDKFVDAIESMHNVDIGLRQSARLMYGTHHHQGLDHVYPNRSSWWKAGAHYGLASGGEAKMAAGHCAQDIRKVT
jgi:hypothetical protein